MKQVLSLQLLVILLIAATSCAPQCAPCPPPYELETQVAALETQVVGASSAPAPSEVPATSTPGGSVPVAPAATCAPAEPCPTCPTCPPPEACPECPACQEEAIVITSPTSGETVSSPILVTGISNPTFEQHLAIQVIGADGAVLVEGAATIGADWGQRGNFEAEVAFEAPPADEPGRVIVFDSSPRDGGLLHLSSVEVTLAGS